MTAEEIAERIDADVEKVQETINKLETVTSTATHFILKKYKEAGRIFKDGDKYERLKVSP